MSTTSEQDRLSFGEFLARVGRVARLFGEVARESTEGARLRIAIVTGMSFLGASALAGTIAALNFFVKGIQSDTPTMAPFFGFPIQNDLPTLTLLIATVLGLQVVNALAVYYVGVSSRAIGRSFHVRSAVRILEAFSQASYLRAGFKGNRSDLTAAVSRYPRIMGTAVEQLISIVQTACYVVGFLVAMFKISVEVSLLTLPVFLLVIPFLYRLSARTQLAAKEFFGDTRAQFSSFARGRFRASDQTNVHPTRYAEARREQFCDADAVRRYLDFYDDLRLSQRRSVLITSLFRGFLLCLILLVLGSFAVRGSYSWGELLVYILALWQFANQVQHLTGNLVGLNRFQPRLAVYYETRTALMEKVTNPAAARLARPLVITSRGDLEGSAGRLEVTRGDRIFYLNDAAVSRMEFAGVLAPLLAACSEQRAVLKAASFCSGMDICPGLRLSLMVLGTETPSADERARLEARIADLGLAQDLAALPDGADTFLSEEAWSAMSQEFRAALRILSLSESPSDLLFIDWELVGSVEKELAARLLAILEDRIVFLVSGDGRIECEWTRGFVVSENEEVVGVGDARWWGEILPYRRQRIPRGRESGLDLDDDDEEEEM